MNIEMAYLLGMIAGNGEIKRENTNTTIAIKLDLCQVFGHNFCHKFDFFAFTKKYQNTFQRHLKLL